MSNHEMWAFKFVSEYTDTPLKTKMEPENRHFEKEHHLPKPHWWVPAVGFSEGMTVSDVDLYLKLSSRTSGDQAFAQKGVGELVGWNTVGDGGEAIRLNKIGLHHMP